MRHNISVEKLSVIALAPDFEALPPLNQAERLRRWADILDAGPRELNSLLGAEDEEGLEQDYMRCEGSPISVAAADTVLRSDGLEADTYGAAKRYFELSDRELHFIACFGHYGDAIPAEVAASRVRMLADKALRRNPSQVAADCFRFARSLINRPRKRAQRYVSRKAGPSRTL